MYKDVIVRASSVAYATINVRFRFETASVGQNSSEEKTWRKQTLESFNFVRKNPSLNLCITWEAYF